MRELNFSTLPFPDGSGCLRRPWLPGKIYQTRGLDADAEAYDLHALDYSSKFAAPTDLLLLKILGSLADRYDKMDRPETSAQYAQRITSALDQAKQETAELGSALIWLGRAEQKLGDYARSDATYGRALDVINRVVPESDPRRVGILIDIGARRGFSEAEEQYRKALALEATIRTATRPRAPRRSAAWALFIARLRGIAKRDRR